MSPQEILRHLHEIRGVGTDVMRVSYGASAVRNSQFSWPFILRILKMARSLITLGNAEEIELRGVKIPRVRIPVKTGRNVSVVIEAAAMNYRAKQMGFDATKNLCDRLTTIKEW